MGKDKNGRELGKGLSQREDGRYSARFMLDGKRHCKYFTKLNDARKWLVNVTYTTQNEKKGMKPQMTVDQYFQYWIEHEKIGIVRKNTVLNYQARYKHNIKEVLGDMYLHKVSTLHCQEVLDVMARENYAPSTIHQVRTTLHALFQSALEDEFIENNPVKRKVRGVSLNRKKERRVLSLEEEKMFLENPWKSKMFYDFAIVLQTGLRVGEVQALRWSDIDLDEKEIHIRRTAHLYPDEREFSFDEPKSAASTRTIPINKECMRLLLELKKRKKPNVCDIQFANLVFVDESGEPISTSQYNYELKKICKEYNIDKISMHCLRHTFATRCIEAGMRPKTLQTILGHTKLSTTMDLYVHVLGETKHEEMEKLDYLNQKII